MAQNNENTDILGGNGVASISTRIHIEKKHVPSWKKWGSLFILSLALAIVVIDTTLLNVSIKNIIIDLKTDLQSIQWVITAYSLALAALTITGGRMGDIFGRKNMFKLGAVLFAVGSLMASFSTSVSMLIWGESIIEGIGAALMMPATASLIVSNFIGRERAIAFGVWGGVAAAASAIGPILGGYLTTNFSWRWGFRINVFVVFCLLIGSVLIREDIVRKKKISIDEGGILLSSVGLLAIVYGFIESTRYGWWKAKEVFSIGNITFDLGGYSIVPFAILYGIIVLVLFVLWEKIVEDRGEVPLVSLHIFKNQQFSSGLITTVVMSLGQAGIIFTLPIFFLTVRGYDAFQTGLSLLPLSISLLIAAPLSAFLGKKFYPKTLILFGLSVNILAYLVLAMSLTVDTSALSIAPGLILYGIGMGFVVSQISNLTLSAVSIEDAGEASGLNNTSRQLGSTLGSAIIGSILLSVIASHLVTDINISETIPAQYKAQISEIASTRTSDIEFSGGAGANSQIPDSIRNEITSITHNATVTGNKTAFLYGALFSLLGLLVSFRLPRVHLGDKKPEDDDAVAVPSGH